MSRHPTDESLLGDNEAKKLILLLFVAGAEPQPLAWDKLERLAVGFVLHGAPPIQLQADGAALILGKSDEAIEREQDEIVEVIADETSAEHDDGMAETVRWANFLTDTGLCTSDADGLRLTARGRAEVAVLKPPGTRWRPNSA